MCPLGQLTVSGPVLLSHSCAVLCWTYKQADKRGRFTGLRRAVSISCLLGITRAAPPLALGSRRPHYCGPLRCRHTYKSLGQSSRLQWHAQKQLLYGAPTCFLRRAFADEVSQLGLLRLRVCYGSRPVRCLELHELRVGPAHRKVHYFL